jgi:hypothetical protein
VYNGSPSHDDNEAEKLFDSAFDRAKKARVKNVFISFHVEDEPMVNLLREQAKNENYDLEFRDYSVKEPFDEKWKTQCKERIAQTSVLVCMIGKETSNREAVNWEINEAYRQGKKVIGVRIHSDRKDAVPEPLKEHHAPIVNWKLKEIQNEIDRK